jgi:hypothetical protein
MHQDKEGCWGTWYPEGPVVWVVREIPLLCVEWVDPIIFLGKIVLYITKEIDSRVRGRRRNRRIRARRAGRWEPATFKKTPFLVGEGGDLGAAFVENPMTLSAFYSSERLESGIYVYL